MFQENAALLKMAKEKLQKRYAENKTKVRIAMKQKQYKLALDHVTIILTSIPDKFDDRYKWAKNMETIVTNQLKRNR